jgi:hypothetical protein
MRTIRAADVVKQRLGIAARRLGTANPATVLGRMLDDSFRLPLGDPRYRQNLFTPGHMPLEHSFSEYSGHSLRLDLEPFGSDISPLTRQQETSRAMRSLVKGTYGDQALHWFDQRSEHFRRGQMSGHHRFGAWFGASFDDGGMRETKVYYELTNDDLEALPPNLLHATRVAMAALPDLRPLGLSIACGRNSGAQRVYLFHNADLRLLDLEPVMNSLGVGHQLPSLLQSLGLVLGGRFTLPKGAAIIGLRDTAKGVEMSLYTLLPAFPDPPREMHGLIQMLLQQRPDAQRNFAQWLQSMTPDDRNGPGNISTVGVRVTQAQPARLNIYFLPVGYDRPAERSRDEAREVSDPYALTA